MTSSAEQNVKTVTFGLEKVLEQTITAASTSVRNPTLLLGSGELEAMVRSPVKVLQD